MPLALVGNWRRPRPVTRQEGGDGVAHRLVVEASARRARQFSASSICPASSASCACVSSSRLNPGSERPRARSAHLPNRNRAAGPHLDRWQHPGFARSRRDGGQLFASAASSGSAVPAGASVPTSSSRATGPAEHLHGTVGGDDLHPRPAAGNDRRHPEHSQLDAAPRAARRSRRRSRFVMCRDHTRSARTQLEVGCYVVVMLSDPRQMLGAVPVVGDATMHHGVEHQALRALLLRAARYGKAISLGLPTLHETRAAPPHRAQPKSKSGKHGSAAVASPVRRPPRAARLGKVAVLTTSSASPSRSIAPQRRLRRHNSPAARWCAAAGVAVQMRGQRLELTHGAPGPLAQPSEPVRGSVDVVGIVQHHHAQQIHVTADPAARRRADRRSALSAVTLASRLSNRTSSSTCRRSRAARASGACVLRNDRLDPIEQRLRRVQPAQIGGAEMHHALTDDPKTRQIHDLRRSFKVWHAPALDPVDAESRRLRCRVEPPLSVRTASAASDATCARRSHRPSERVIVDQIAQAWRFRRRLDVPGKPSPRSAPGPPAPLRDPQQLRKRSIARLGARSSPTIRLHRQTRWTSWRLKLRRALLVALESHQRVDPQIDRLEIMFLDQAPPQRVTCLSRS